MTIFALSRSKIDVTIYRLPIGKDLEKTLLDELKQQEKDFLKDNLTEVSFSGSYIPDEAEILIIQDFDEAESLFSAIKDPSSIPFYSAKNDVSDIKALFWESQSSQGGIALQRFQKKNIISVSKFALFFSGNVFVKNSENGISIGEKIDIVITPDKTMKFFSFRKTQGIFTMKPYLITATDSDMDTFAKYDCIEIEDITSFRDSEDHFVRRKIKNIHTSGHLVQAKADDLKRIADQFGVDLQINNNTIIIPSEIKKLKEILHFLDEDYFHSSIQKSKYVTNSKKPV